MKSGYASRKFVLATVFTLTGCGVYAFTTKMSGGEFVTLAGLILTAFTAGDVALNQIHKNKIDPPKEDE